MHRVSETPLHISSNKTMLFTLTLTIPVYVRAQSMEIRS